MKNFMVVCCCLFLSLSILSAQDTMGKKDEKMEKKEMKMDKKEGMSKKGGMMKKGEMYCCTMHPDMKSDKPGKCSVCGMEMTMAKGGMKKGDMMKKNDMKKDDMKKDDMKK